MREKSTQIDASYMQKLMRWQGAKEHRTSFMWRA
jgi:hypothetical protein